MKSTTHLLFSILFIFSSLAASGEDVIEEVRTIPSKGLHAIGGLAGISSYNGHTALAHIAKGDHSSRAKLIRAAQDTGGIMGGTNEVVKMLKGLLTHVPEGEKVTLNSLVEMNALVVEEGKSLLAYLKAKANEGDIETSWKAFKVARAKAAKAIAALLKIDAKLVE